MSKTDERKQAWLATLKLKYSPKKVYTVSVLIILWTKSPLVFWYKPGKTSVIKTTRGMSRKIHWLVFRCENLPESEYKSISFSSSSDVNGSRCRQQ